MLRTNWLSLQEVNVMKDIPLFCSQVVQPIFNDSLAFLQNKYPHENSKQCVITQSHICITAERTILCVQYYVYSTYIINK